MSHAEGRLTSVSALIDALAWDLSQRWPDRVLTGLEHLMLGRRPSLEEARELRVEVVRGHPTLVVRVLGPHGPALTARAQLSDHHPEPPGTSLQLPVCDGVPNGTSLYALEGDPETRESGLRALGNVRRHGSAGLIAALQVPRASIEAAPGGSISAPAVLEGMLQLGRWTWFTMTGERARLDGIESLTCYRLPRAGERLRLESLLRGASAELPRFDVLGCTEDGAPLLTLRGLRLAPGPDRGFAGRLPWQSFLQVLQSHHPVPGAPA